jgi:hypothetical protein
MTTSEIDKEPLRLNILLYREGSMWKWRITETIVRTMTESWRDAGRAMTREEAVVAANASYDRLQQEAVKRREEVAMITKQFDAEHAQRAKETTNEDRRNR